MTTGPFINTQAVGNFCLSHEVAIKLCDPLGNYGTALPRNGVQQLVKSEFSVFPSQVSQHAA